MMRLLLVIGSTAIFASAGAALGLSVHGSSPLALVQVISGAAGGLGIGCAGLHVIDRRHSLRTRS